VEATDRWYFIHAISNGTNDALLASQYADASLITLPSGYGFSALLGAWRNDGGSNLIRATQRGNEVALKPASAAGGSSSALNPLTGAPLVEFTDVAPIAANTFQSADLNQCIPPGIATRVQGILGHRIATSGALRAYGVAGLSESGSLAGTGTLQGAQFATTAVGASQPTAFGFTAAMCFDVPVVTSQTLYWACHSATIGSTPTVGHSMRITGFSLALH
jgi:hypothetical protein